MSALHYEMHGRGRDVVLLHGWSSNLGIWQELVARLARRFRVGLAAAGRCRAIGFDCTRLATRTGDGFVVVANTAACAHD